MTKPFRTLIEEATEKLAKELYKPEYNRSSWDENVKPRGAFVHGAALPNELLLLALQALDGCSKCTDEYLWTSRADAKRVVNEIISKLEGASK